MPAVTTGCITKKFHMSTGKFAPRREALQCLQYLAVVKTSLVVEQQCVVYKV